MDAHYRQRQAVVPVRPSVRRDMTNGELLEAFQRTVSGKLAASTIERYSGSIRDAIRYFTSEGREVPVRSWTKEAIWAYLHFIEQNYCASFAPAAYKPAEAMCRQRVWIGSKPAATAAAENCAACPLFKRPGIEHRLNALNRFFKFLARLGVVSHNFMADVVSEHYEESPGRTDHRERRRNPSVDEERTLVNETAHPQRRAFYAASAKWWFRPNEMFLLDRYASFGLPTPAGLPKPRGFENGFTAHPHLASFAEGGDLVYIPETKGHTDKRKGNRWSVIDAELRPILEQHLAWWERTVKRDNTGRPVTTRLWLTETGRPLGQKKMYETLFHDDTKRLGLVTEEEARDPRRAWTAHCQRHFGEKLLEMHNVPDSWCNHFRGDTFQDARGHYYKPTPEDMRAKYRELVPLLGFKPLPDVQRLRLGVTSEKDAHAALLQAEAARLEGVKHTLDARTLRLVVGEEIVIVPRRLAGSFLFAAKHAHPNAGARLEMDSDVSPRGRRYTKAAYAALLERGLVWLA